MKFPKLLLLKNRGVIGSHRIRDWNYLYSRHKPSTNWLPEENLPDFTKIKMDQSFNWSNYSIPVWARFNDTGDYLSDYAVAGFKVDTIRNEHIRENIFKTPVLDIIHVPLEMNYSHCELKSLKKFSKTEKRALRMTLRHNCIVPLMPDQVFSMWSLPLEILKMFSRRLISIFWN